MSNLYTPSISFTLNIEITTDFDNLARHEYQHRLTNEVVMKKMNTLLLAGSMLFSQFAVADDIDTESLMSYFDIGVSVITTKSDSSDDRSFDGVVFMSYDGYEYDLEDMNINLIPTSVEVSIDGKKVQAYTDLATLTYYSIEDLELMISLVEIDYKKNNDFKFKKEDKVVLVNAGVSKIINLGKVENSIMSKAIHALHMDGIEIDLNAEISFGGRIRSKSLLDNEIFSDKESHRYTTEISIGAIIPLGDTTDLYVYGASYRQVGENSKKRGVVIGANLSGFEVGKSVSASPYVEYVSERVTSTGFSGSEEDTKMLFGVRFTF